MPHEDDLELAERFRAAVGAFVRTTRDATRMPSNARVETLGFLDRNGPQSAAELARLRGVTHQAMRETAQEMIEENLLSHTPDPRDGRRKLYRLTPEGAGMLESARRTRSRWLAENWIGVLDDGERQTLKNAIALLERLDAK